MATDHTKQVYYGAMVRAGRWQGRVFRYDATGNYHRLIWESTGIGYRNENEAIDAALEYCEQNGYDDAVAGE